MHVSFDSYLNIRITYYGSRDSVIVFMNVHIKEASVCLAIIIITVHHVDKKLTGIRILDVIYEILLLS